MITRDPYGISRPPIRPGRLPEPPRHVETGDTPENMERCLHCTEEDCNGAPRPDCGADQAIQKNSGVRTENRKAEKQAARHRPADQEKEGCALTDYIERQAAVRVVQDYGIRAIQNGARELDPVDDIVKLARELDAMPAAKVGPRGIYGHWWDDGSGNIMCSVCCSNGSSKFKYCPMCGTKMIEGAENG